VNRVARLLVLGVTGWASLTAAVLPAAAQPGGPCALAPDAVLVSALGPSAHGVQGLTAPDLESCSVGEATHPSIAIYHISGPFGPDELTAPLGPGQTGAPGASRDVDQQGPDVQVTPADGLSDPAVFLKIPLGDAGTLLVLRVQHGADVFAFNTPDAPDGQARLMALARAVLTNLGS
jgi:hypothetical protein